MGTIRGKGPQKGSVVLDVPIGRPPLPHEQNFSSIAEAEVESELQLNDTEPLASEEQPRSSSEEQQEHKMTVDEVTV